MINTHFLRAVFEAIRLDICTDRSNKVDKRPPPGGRLGHRRADIAVEDGTAQNAGVSTYSGNPVGEVARLTEPSVPLRLPEAILNTGASP